MTANRIRFVVVSLVVTAVLLGGSLVTAAARRGDAEPDSLYKYLTVFTEVLGLVQQAYVVEPQNGPLLAGAYEGVADALGAFSVYVPAADAERFRRQSQEGPPDSGMFLIRDRGWMYVASLLPDSPAATAGLEQGDLLARVGGTSTRDLDVWEVQERLAGAAGEEGVQLEVLRRGERLMLPFRLVPYEVAITDRRDVRGVPVLRIARFDDGTVAAVREALAGLSGETRLLLDLRSVAGGDPREALAVADLFGDGMLGELRRRGEVLARYDGERPDAWDGRLVVAVDRGTLGPSELLAVALRETADATLVGDTTFGHAGRSTVVELSSGSLIQVTDAFYAGPTGVVLDHGVEPDVLVEERSRKLREKDLTYQDLILERGVSLLLGELEAEARAA